MHVLFLLVSAQNCSFCKTFRLFIFELPNMGKENTIYYQPTAELELDATTLKCSGYFYFHKIFGDSRNIPVTSNFRLLGTCKALSRTCIYFTHGEARGRVRKRRGGWSFMTLLEDLAQNQIKQFHLMRKREIIRGVFPHWTHLRSIQSVRKFYMLKLPTVSSYLFGGQ